MLSLLLKYHRNCLLALCVLLGLACGSLADTLLGIRLGRGLSAPPARSAPQMPASAGEDTADLAYIQQHHLFDSASRTETPPPFSLRREDSSAGAVAAPANFELIGMVAAGNRSIAVLRSGQEVKGYRVGAELPGGGKIEEILRHQVRIRNPNYSITTLTMYEGDRTAPARPGPGQTMVGGDEVRAAGENRWIIPRATAETVRDNLGEQLRLALMQPRIVDGRTDGFIIKKITGGSLLAKMGLRRGDVLKRVNSMTIDSPEKALQILQQLREARQLNVDLERDGKPLSFAYAIE